MKKIIVALTLALSLFGANSAAAEDVAPTAKANPYAPDTFVIGDSITQLGYEEIHARHPSWFVFGIGGMSVESMPAMVDHFLKWQPKPRMMVLALGTNASATWTKEKFQAVLDRIPSSTKVALVTTYRDPVKFSQSFPYDGSRASYQDAYSTWMRDFANASPRICVVPWRGWIYQHQTRLYDGVHPDAAGQIAWANLVSFYAARCD